MPPLFVIVKESDAVAGEIEILQSNPLLALKVPASKKSVFPSDEMLAFSPLISTVRTLPFPPMQADSMLEESELADASASSDATLFCDAELIFEATE